MILIREFDSNLQNGDGWAQSLKQAWRWAALKDLTCKEIKGYEESSSAKKKATEVSETASGVRGACCQASRLSTTYMVEREPIQVILRPNKWGYTRTLTHNTLSHTNTNIVTHTHNPALIHTINIENNNKKSCFLMATVSGEGPQASGLSISCQHC